jgi:hypothetical protein
MFQRLNSPSIVMWKPTQVGTIDKASPYILEPSQAKIYKPPTECEDKH